MKIFNNISRLILHDSHFVKEIRNEDNLEVIFDWAKLENFSEENITEPIVMGKTTLRIYGITNEELKVFYDDYKYTVIDFPDNIGKYWNLVCYTRIDDDKQSISLDGVYDYEEKKGWAEWDLNYNNCEVEWTSHITHKEWLAGALPVD